MILSQEESCFMTAYNNSPSKAANINYKKNKKKTNKQESKECKKPMMLKQEPFTTAEESITPGQFRFLL
jgi:hypothetical protein